MIKKGKIIRSLARKRDVPIIKCVTEKIDFDDVIGLLKYLTTRAVPVWIHPTFEDHLSYALEDFLGKRR